MKSNVNPADLNATDQQPEAHTPEAQHDPQQKWQELQFDTHLRGQLQQQLREQVSQSLNKHSSSSDLATTATTVVETLFSAEPQQQKLSIDLEALFQQQRNIYQQSNIPKHLRKRQYISGSGLIMSPDHCITTLRDSERVGAFIKGIDIGIKELKRKKCNDNKPLHIVYPACGPFAPLLLPLLSFYQTHGIYSPADITVTLIDIQEGAILSLQALVTALGLESYVTHICHQDACHYRPQQAVDMVVLEAMQHGFSREGHLVMARHFAKLLEPDGLLIPKEISIGAALTLAQQEFIEQWKNNDSKAQTQPLQDTTQRTDLGEILNINIDTLRCLKEQVIDEHTHLVECATVEIPVLKNNHDKQCLIFYTRMNTYGNHWINEYQSGITHPLPDLQVCINFTPQESRQGDLLVKSGDSLTFYYCLNGMPGFLTTLTPQTLAPQSVASDSKQKTTHCPREVSDA